MKSFLLSCLLLLSVTGFGQASLSGATSVQPGAWETYNANFQSWDWQMSSASWYVSGGTIIWSDNRSCTVRWNNGAGTGWVYVEESQYWQSTSLDVHIGDAVPSIYPSYQTVSYGTAPGAIDVSFNYTPSGSVFYQWQEWDAATAGWNNLAQYAASFFPPPLTQSKRYRCVVSSNGVVYDNLEAEVVIPALSPGSIYYAGPPHLAYNAALNGIVSYPASGGYCVSGSYAYVWEQSVENGPWVQVGTGENPPSFSPVIGNIRIRRSVACNGELLYTNVLSLDPAYTAVDFENKNYVREITVVKKGVQSWQEADRLPIGDKFQVTTYSDGLGRPVQSVNKGVSQTASNAWNDLVKHYEYDAAGRMLKDFLPYSSGTNPGKFKPGAESEQKLAIQSLYSEPSTAATYTLSETDGSPLNRITKITAPGQGWAGASVSADLDFNTLAENVRIWNLDYAVGAAPVSAQAYGDGALVKNVTTDENGKKLITYTDLEGKLILKKVQLKEAGAGLTGQHDGWICTYNVYDDFGRLCFQLQPEAVNYLDGHSWSFAGTEGPTVLKELCFQYRYDEKGRNTWKKAPGAEPLVMLYDVRDRLVFTQDGNQRAKSTPEWMATLYDDLDRPVVTILYNTTKTAGNLQADIDNAPASNATITTSNPGITITAYQSPVNGADVNNPAVCTVLKYRFYDTYNHAGAKPFDAAVDNTAAYPTGDPNVRPIAPTDRTTGFTTGSLVRVLGTGTFLASTTYYDERGAQIQTAEDNLKGGSDVVTLQYSFDGRVLSTHSKHTTAGTGYTAFGILTKNNFDKTGRITGIEKRFGNNPFKTIAAYGYDETGRLKLKTLHPDYRSGSGLESLRYSYNIQGQLTGVNKEYALKEPGTYDKWGHFFGFYLGFDNRDGVFSGANLSGKVAGQLWTTQGDDAQRRYDYTYDNAGRLTKAAFTERQKRTDNWDNAKMDFSVKGEGTSETITYDLNGNLLSLIQKGVLLTTTGPVEIDRLKYTYAALSNRLLNVSDGATTSADNGRAGDFKGSNNGSLSYDYDDNGNLTVDPNKGDFSAASPGAHITYNHLDKPVTITVPGKGTIQLVYDADGTKLQKIFTPVSGSAVTTTYINGYVYKDNDLQYIGFEEGRIRVMDYVSQTNGYDFVQVAGNLGLPNGKQGALDYFLRDYQQNVRMIVTEETHRGQNSCTMETARAAGEEPLFGQSGGGNEVVASRFAVANIPGQSVGDGWNHPDIGSQVSCLGKLAAKKVGPNVLLKVMAGDEIATTALYYYKNPVSPGRGTTLLNDVLSSLVQAITGSPSAPALTKDATANISTNLGGYYPFTHAIAPDADNDAGSAPKAYLNVLFFNERMEFVKEGSAAVRVEHEGNNTLPLLLQHLRAPKNGYCYVYLSNESDEAVYFDNFRVQHERGRIIEEDHYYAYGLKIAALSSQKAGDPHERELDNKHLYNDKELIDEADLGWYDYGFRNYDPQIGRFPQLDPLTFEYPFLTPYQYASCDPATNIDVDGLEGVPADPTRLSGAMLPEVLITRGGSGTVPHLPLYLTSSLFDRYVNAAGQSFVQSFMVNRPTTQLVLGEEWRYHSTITDYSYTTQRTDNVMPEFRAAPPEKASLWKVFWVMLRGQSPVVYDLINSPVVGAKTLGSAPLGYRKQGVTGLAGERTTFEERYMGGVSLLSSAITPMVGAETDVAMGGIQYGSKDDLFMSYVSKAQQPAGVLDVAVHGSPTMVEIGTNTVNHRVLADLISRNPQFTGQPIRLLSCNTGVLPNGFAQNLANKLGVPVSAPNNLLWAFQNGRLTIGATPTINNGSFIKFFPGGR